MQEMEGGQFIPTTKVGGFLAQRSVSGYKSDLYFDKLKNWKSLEFDVKTTMNDASLEQAKRTEIVWFNEKFDIHNKTGRFW